MPWIFQFIPLTSISYNVFEVWPCISNWFCTWWGFWCWSCWCFILISILCQTFSDRHALFPLLALLFERCEQATRSPDCVSVAGLKADIQLFVQHQQQLHDTKSSVNDNPEVDSLVRCWNCFYKLNTIILELDFRFIINILYYFTVLFFYFTIQIAVDHYASVQSHSIVKLYQSSTSMIRWVSSMNTPLHYNTSYSSRNIR